MSARQQPHERSAEGTVERTCPRCGLHYAEQPDAAREPSRVGWCPRCGSHPDDPRAT